MLLDNGRYIFAPADDDDLIRRPSDAPVEDKSWRMTGLRFDKGRLVDCAFGEGDDDWVTGTVVLTSYREGGLVFPYQIETQDGYLIAAPEDDDGCIRSSDNYRFQVGTRVECIVEEGWLPGTVTGVDVVRSSPDYTHKVYSPYEVQLDNGHVVYAPVDGDTYVKACNAPLQECYICYGNTQTKTNLILSSTCLCKGVFAHTQCLVELATVKFKGDEEPTENPFFGCLTCRSGYCEGSIIHSELTRAYYRLCKDYEVSLREEVMSMNSMAKLLISEMKYDEATELIEERMGQAKTNITEAVSNSDENAKLAFECVLFETLKLRAKVHEALGQWTDFKSVLEEALQLFGDRTDASSIKSKCEVCRKLAVYAYKQNEKGLALQHLERARYQSAEEPYLHLQMANINLELGNRETGIQLVETALNAYRKRRGREDCTVVYLEGELRKLREGVLLMLASDGIHVNLT